MKIPGELSPENMIIFISENNMCVFYLWKDYRWYGHIIKRVFHSKKWSEIVWYFIGVYIINRTLHGR